MDYEEIFTKDSKGQIHGPLRVWNRDPWFVVYEPHEYPNVAINVGDTLIRNEPSGEDHRTIFAVTDVVDLFYAEIHLLAPRQITKPNAEAPYLKWERHDGSIMELRPGTKIIGGRESGFYDNYGIILEGRHTGGDFKKFEDWVYFVIAPSHFGKLASQWILADQVGFPVSEPVSITGFDMTASKTIDELLAAGEHELFEYFVTDPGKFEDLKPKQFEELVAAIYKNLGFSTETVGAWNQSDGGVDVIAVSKTDAGTEFRLAIQCKTSKNKISARTIRELAGVLDAFKAHQGIVATTSRFTSSARSEAEGHLWKVTLQDRDELYRRIVSILFPYLDD